MPREIKNSVHARTGDTSRTCDPIQLWWADPDRGKTSCQSCKIWFCSWPQQSTLQGIQAVSTAGLLTHLWKILKVIWRRGSGVEVCQRRLDAEKGGLKQHRAVSNYLTAQRGEQDLFQDPVPMPNRIPQSSHTKDTIPAELQLEPRPSLQHPIRNSVITWKLIKACHL